MGSSINSLIKKTNLPIRKILYNVVPFKYRYGKKYLEFLDFLKKSRNWSYDEAINYQIKKLNEVLNLANNNVPYYQNLFRENGFDFRIKNLEDIKKIPYLTKEIIIDNFDLLVNQNFFKKKYRMNTSGTTGKRLEILGTDNMFKIEAAFITNSILDQGAKLYEQHSIWIRRYSPNPGEPLFVRDFELNRTYMSVFDLNDQTVFSYVDYINKSKSRILISYPSTIYYLAVLCSKYDLKLKNVKFIHGASEVCLPIWREVIFKTFGIPIKMHYGQVEKVSFAHQDMEDDYYKENLLYSYNEFDSENTILGTGFYNEIMPLIRYKTNDIIIHNEFVERKNSYPKTIKDILGRNGDMLLTEKNSLVPAVNFYSFMSKIKEVDLFQIVQERKSKKVRLSVVPNFYYSKITKQNLISEMKKRLGEVEIDVIEVQELVRDKKSNKMKTISLI